MIKKEIIGDATLYLGDCQEIMSTLGMVNAVITDPPYSKETAKGSLTRDDESTNWGKQYIPFSVDENFLRIIFHDASKILNGWAIVFCDWRHCSSFGINPIDGLKFIRFGIWNKINGAPQFTGDRPAPGWEAIAIMHKDRQGKMQWNGGGKRSVWSTTIDKQNGHPTPKSLQLMNEIVNDFTNHGDIILDPFMGSGTTGVACINQNRKFIGIEIEQKYFDIACERIEQAQNQGKLFKPAKYIQKDKLI